MTTYPWLKCVTIAATLAVTIQNSHAAPHLSEDTDSPWSQCGWAPATVVTSGMALAGWGDSVFNAGARQPGQRFG